MGFAFQGYCYETVVDASIAMRSSLPMLSDPNYNIVGFVDGTDATVLTVVPSSTAGNLTSLTHVVNFPVCPTVGSLTSDLSTFLTGFTSTLRTFFEFDPALFELLVGGVLVTWISGVSLGLVISFMRRT